MSTPHAESVVTAKGQVTLRRAIREHIGVRPGQKVEFIPLPDGRMEVRAARGVDFSPILGILRRPGQTLVTVEQMNETIARGWAGDIAVRDDAPCT